MENRFYIFGSANSLDIDVFVEVDNIGSDITIGHALCQKFDRELANIIDNPSNKPLNSNLIVVKDGIITACFKGTPDECNNALFYTYSLHRQYHNNPIRCPVPRNMDIKTLRVTRCILSYFSRGGLRLMIKSALKQTIFEQLEVLKRIDFQNPIEGKKDSSSDIYKIIAFQFGQFFSLIDGKEPESYSKIDISNNYPPLSPFLQRQDNLDMMVLNAYLDKFIAYLNRNIEYMSITSELDGN